eukprot:SAG22_NODE_1196_length_5198_cov_3.167092_6_plen_359_part_01
MVQTGGTCDIALDECISQPCQNNAMECVDVFGDFECRCAPGWVGQDCSIDYDECGSDPCQNGAACSDRQSNYHCACTVGWAGHECEADRDECASAPCRYGGHRGFWQDDAVPSGGNCTDSNADAGIPFNAYACSCGAGFSGSECELDFDECSSGPCRASTTANCIDGWDGFFCNCTTGYTGETCELEVNPCLLQGHQGHDCDPAVSYCSHTGPGMFECTCIYGQSWSSSQDGDGGSHSWSQVCTNQTINPALLIYHGAPELCLDYNTTTLEYDGCPTNPYGRPYDNGPICTPCEMDQCGTCDCNSTNNCAVDCSGVWGGVAAHDRCDVCGGDDTLCQDCAGVLYGRHLVDECGTCDNST